MDLTKKKCIPCEGYMPPLKKNQVAKHLKQIKGWSIEKGKVTRTFLFNDFKKTLNFVNKVGKIAESEGHHPDIYFTWGKCKIQIYTHSIKGLSENDFILAAKINKLI